MPLLNEQAVEGQSKQYTINTGKDLTAATDVRLYYKTSDGSGYWDLTTGVTVVSTYSIRYTHHDIPAGTIVLVPHAEWSDGFISRSPDPVIYTVKPLYTL